MKLNLLSVTGRAGADLSAPNVIGPKSVFLPPKSNDVVLESALNFNVELDAPNTDVFSGVAIEPTEDDLKSKVVGPKMPKDLCSGLAVSFAALGSVVEVPKMEVEVPKMEEGAFPLPPTSNVLPCDDDALPKFKLLVVVAVSGTEEAGGRVEMMDDTSFPLTTGRANAGGSAVGSSSKSSSSSSSGNAVAAAFRSNDFAVASAGSSPGTTPSSGIGCGGTGELKGVTGRSEFAAEKARSMPVSVNTATQRGRST